MRYQQSLFLVALGGMLLISCKKDEESDPPQIFISSPFNGQSLAVPDTFTIVADVTDDKGPIQGTVVLTNGFGVPIGPVFTFNSDGTSTNINFNYPVVSEQIASGPHSLRISVSDGDNTTNAFRTINVVGTPLRFRGLFAVTASGAVHKVDSAFNLTTLGSYGQDVNDAAISSRQQLLYIAGAETGPLAAMDVNTGATRWQVPNNGSGGEPYFSYCSMNDDMNLMLIGKRSGTLHVMNPAYGSNITTHNISSSRLPISGLITGNNVISIESQTISPTTRFVTRNLYSDNALTETIIDQQTVDLFQRDEDHALVFGNENGTGRVTDMNFSSGFGFEPHAFGQGEIADVVQVDEDTYLLVLPDGITRYTYNPDQALLLSALVPQQLAYDPANGMLFASTGTTLHVLDANTGFETMMVVLPAIPLKLLVLLNR
ncbi:MAG: hypothetical protein IPG74_07915 [Flavobacteriales bacterium]|nr:hypothetical protein [Flavobacteriales bacterium]